MKSHWFDWMVAVALVVVLGVAAAQEMPGSGTGLGSAQR
jgi:hypothetical protein